MTILGNDLLLHNNEVTVRMDGNMMCSYEHIYRSISYIPVKFYEKISYESLKYSYELTQYSYSSYKKEDILGGWIYGTSARSL
jgi:phosphoglucomutase